MQIQVDTSITIFGQQYSPIERVSEQQKTSRTRLITYLYIIPYKDVEYSVYLSHFTEHPDLFSINVRTGRYTISDYKNDNIDRKYAGSLCTEIQNVESEIEQFIAEHLRYSDIVAYVKSQYPDQYRDWKEQNF